MTKIYGIRGYVHARIHVPAGDGRAFLDLEFTKGVIGGTNSRPATYLSVSETEQNIIERSPLFGNSIFLYRSYGVAKPVAAAPAAPVQAAAPAMAPAAAPALMEEPAEDAKSASAEDVTTLAEAILYLKARGVKASSLKTAKSAKNAASALGIVFPNYTFED